MMSPPVVVTDLTVMRGTTLAVDAVSLSLRAGTITGLLGPSGSGKTTLMRAVIGSQRLTSGSVTVLGHPAGSPPVRARVGYMAQVPALYSDLTVTENLRHFGTLLGVDNARVDEVIDLVDLGSRRSAMVHTLSGGELNRASLGAALIGSPEVLVLDEPTVGLDPLLRRDLWASFRALADSGVTLLVSSHVMDEAERCDRLLLMREGAILADGTPAEIKDAAGADDIESAFLRLVEGTA
jgi:ABC-2 type transport system ATP-binding protein